MPDDSGWNDDVGFEYSFQTDDDEWPEGRGRHLWICAEEGGDLERIAHLVQKFLRKFRPDQCWSLSYSETCSKPRVGEFGGRAMFVTAADIKWQSSYSFRCAEGKAFAERSSAKGGT